MSLRSMTGFGIGTAVAGGLRAEVEVTSVNRKQFDLRVGVPRGLASLEARIYEQVHGAVQRGCVTVTVRLDACGADAARTVHVDETVAGKYVRQLRGLAARLGLDDSLRLADVAALPGVLHSAAATEDPRVAWPPVRRALESALRALAAMKKKEGRCMADDLERRLKRLAARVSRVERWAPQVVRQYRRRLHDRLAQAGLDLSRRDPLLARELAVFADRVDISEELVRLRSHLSQAMGLLSAGGHAGRTLDFLCQEILREVNTIGSKGNDLRISREVIAMKSALESIREQVQNIE